MHALDFTEKPEYELLARWRYDDRFAGPVFIEWLLGNGRLVEIECSNAANRDLVFYFDDQGRSKHAGLWLGDKRVQSKWGIGHLYKHQIFEVPESYGTNVRFFKRLPFEEAF
jgi:hypothetical protein